MSRVVLALLAALAFCGVGASGADFTASSHSPTTITAAADFNTVTVTLGAVPANPLGSVALSATAASERGIASVRFQYAPTGTSDWVDVCTDTTSAYGCTWDTLAIPDAVYDVRALATDSAGYTKTSVATGRTVDNYTLSVTLTDPGAMSGNESLTATAANPTGALAELTIQHRAPGAASWTTVCTDTVSPKTCSLNTTALPEGPRELRAIARDTAGHQVQSTTITRTIDNTPPQVTPNTPTSGSGTVTMTATASDSGSGIAYVKWEAFYMGAWYEFCRDTAAPYSCSGDSAAVPDGTYSIRVTTVDNAGVSTMSPPSSITIDNPPRGVSLATGNAGTPGQLGSGDWIELVWNEQIAPASVLAGWNGAGQAIRVRVKDATSNDEMDFLTTGGTRLNLVLGAADLKLGGNFVTADSEFNATMSQTGPTIRITLGAPLSGTLATAAAGNLSWKPSTAATDLTGHTSSSATVTEGGSLDVDF